MEVLNNIVSTVDGWVWGIPLITILLATGIYLTIRTKLIQVIHLPRALKFIFKKEETDDGDSSGDVSSFAALCTALSATIGTGNIVGVAGAIAAGGPGALFWMLIAAFFGMATKYAEGLLAIKYRITDNEGKMLGGPFYYIENGMGKRWKWLAKLFAVFGAGAGLLGIGTITQVHGIASSVGNFFDPDNAITLNIFGQDISIYVMIAGLVITVATALVVVGGIQRISSVAGVVVPFMAILYVIFCLVVIAVNITAIPHAIALIFQGAFDPAAITGGAVGSFFIAMQNGISRGIFSNESGLGSAPIASAAAKTKEPVRQGLVSMTGTFIDTIIICTMTGLTIIITGAWKVPGLEGVAITTNAFQQGLSFLPSQIPSFILMVCLVFFAFTTILGWNYYGERCLEYLTNQNRIAVLIYRILYIAAVLIGPYLTAEAVWGIANIFNGMMAFPNLIALLALSGVVAKETRDYVRRMKEDPRLR